MVLRSVRGRSLFLRFFAESGCGLILGREKKIKNWREIHPLDPLLVRSDESDGFSCHILVH